MILLNDKSIFDEAAEIYATLSKKGAIIEDADILIASVLKASKFILISDDTHFNRIQGVRIENWLA